MSFADLKDEITVDPEGIGYAGKTDEEVLVLLTTKDRSRNRTSLSGSQVLNAIDDDEWNSRSDAQRQMVWNIVHMGTVNPFGIESTLMATAFAGAGGVTLGALNDARVESISRLVELKLGKIALSDIAKARV